MARRARQSDSLRLLVQRMCCALRTWRGYPTTNGNKLKHGVARCETVAVPHPLHSDVPVSKRHHILSFAGSSGTAWLAAKRCTAHHAVVLGGKPCLDTSDDDARITA